MHRRMKLGLGPVIWLVVLLGCTGLLLLLWLAPLWLAALLLVVIVPLLLLWLAPLLLLWLAPLWLAALLLLVIVPLLLLWLPLLSWEHGEVYGLDRHLRRRLRTEWVLVRWATEWIVGWMVAGS